MKPLKLGGSNYFVEPEFIKNLSLTLPQLRTLEVRVSCGSPKATLTLQHYFKQLSKLEELEDVFLTCLDLSQKDFDASISSLNIGLTSLGIYAVRNRSQVLELHPTVTLRVKAEILRKGLKNVPHLTHLSCYGFKMVTYLEREQIEQLFKEQSVEKIKFTIQEFGCYRYGVQNM
jgi:hypothetical protein